MEDLYTQRIHHTLTLALTPEHADSLVVFSENVGGYDTWQKAVASFHRQLDPAVSADLRLRCVADWNALYTGESTNNKKNNNKKNNNKKNKKNNN